MKKQHECELLCADLAKTEQSFCGIE